MLNLLGKNLGAYKRYAIIAPLFILIETAAGLIMPRIMSDIVDLGIAAGNTQQIFRNGILMAVLAVIGLLAGISSSRMVTIASQGVGSNLRTSIFRHMQTFSFADVDRFSTASLITRATTDVNTIQTIFQMSLRILSMAPFQLIVSLAIVFSYSGKLALIFLCAIPVLFGFVMLLMKMVHHLFMVMREKLDNVNSTVQENLVAIRVVKSFVREDYEREKFKKANNALTKAGLNAISKMVLMMPVATIIINSVMLLIYWFGGNMVGSGALAPGGLLAIISYLTQIMLSVMMFSMIMMQLPRAQTSSERISEVLSANSDIKDPPAPISGAAELKGQVEFKNVHFRYSATGSGEDVIKGISFTAKPGETVAVVGDTGSGKSSLVNLIPRFYDVSEGQVLVGGVDVREQRLEELRDGIGMVLQKNVLFSGTIRENMKWGSPYASDEEIISALKDAQAYDFVSKFPEGLDYMIAQGGTNVSGGQRQRLCIARAIIKQPSILILDDSTSAVDSDTESKIRKSFDESLKNCTVFIIAQRISSVVSADKIIVLDENGGVDGIGTHDELMGKSRVYQEIYSIQQKGGLSDV